MIQRFKLMRPALTLAAIVLTAPILARQMQNHDMCNMQGHDMSKMDCMKMDKGVMKCNMPGMASVGSSHSAGKMTDKDAVVKHICSKCGD